MEPLWPRSTPSPLRPRWTSVAPSKVRTMPPVRLLCHYFVYIGKIISLLDPSCAKISLLNTAKDQWNKAGTFAWLEHPQSSHSYCRQTFASTDISSLPPVEAQPPANTQESNQDQAGVVPKFPDVENANCGDLISDTDLFKFISCGVFWPDVDSAGACSSRRTARRGGYGCTMETAETGPPSKIVPHLLS
ncbi:hypothetical protein K432DRAFT_390245 [Lepidopterella palustris CBS 459.81]|uniref:Uncharacterized protein n=1 Tax=Lepidopterella palustris CBS 459.81 TaxID=1314670 RepID=A0A8E2EGY3_9PEZI|nr:hypothetical protein K432DRAFT_390245 [Lepidopterella palustris CBS 459.81]